MSRPGASSPRAAAALLQPQPEAAIYYYSTTTSASASAAALGALLLLLLAAHVGLVKACGTVFNGANVHASRASDRAHAESKPESSFGLWL
mmetsp:Transcript_12658/g.19176  ORF Transcript_12658/g.19176 Transcript_12658/m.19176 type:complete len:91 (+) Transcript_12658:52-324(+)